MTSRQQEKRYTTRTRTVAVSLSVLLLCFSETSAWTPNQKPFHSQHTRKDPSSIYLPPTSKKQKSPQPQKKSITAQKMLKTPGNPRARNELFQRSKVKLSHSVLASCDTLPAFPTAHGMLSPETVMRLEELTAHGHRSEALSSFLEAYRENGPLSCLPMLSDPDVLPHLTEAMRDIAA